HLSGQTQKKVAAAVGFNAATVHAVLHRHHAARPATVAQRMRGSRLDRHAHDIIRAYNQGETIIALGRAYGCSPFVVRLLLERRAPGAPPGSRYCDPCTPAGA